MKEGGTEKLTEIGAFAAARCALTASSITVMHGAKKEATSVLWNISKCFAY
jgi:hypothetical protein